MFRLTNKGQASFEILLAVVVIVVLAGYFFLHVGNASINFSNTAKARLIVEAYLTDKKLDSLKKISLSGNAVKIYGINLNEKQKEDLNKALQKEGFILNK